MSLQTQKATVNVDELRKHEEFTRDFVLETGIGGNFYVIDNVEL
jgi:hypothetical protein